MGRPTRAWKGPTVLYLEADGHAISIAHLWCASIEYMTPATAYCTALRVVLESLQQHVQS